METFYALFTEGVLESRKSFIYGPFCIVYGIAAIILIFLLKRFKTNSLKLFSYGAIIGSTIEYTSSYMGEAICHVKWWDYSNSFLNVNGRTCLYYAIWWGILSVILVKYFNPVLDKYINIVINKISNAFLKISIVAITIFMTIDGIVTCYALENFLARISSNYEINIKGIDIAHISNSDIDINIDTLFSDEKMMMTYPNIIIVNDRDEIIQLKTVLADVKNYYYKF